MLEQNKIKEQAFLDFVTAIEKEKVYYYVLAYTVSQPVLLIKTPTTTAGIKTFLGYGWSGSKGNEGIQYLNVGKSKTDEDNEDEEEDDTMNQIRGIGGIQTPLFDPSNLADDDKINTLIRKNFMGENIMIPSDLAEYVSKARLVDMIDFSRTSFTKEFKTVVGSFEDIETKWPLVKLKNVCKNIVSGGDKPKNMLKESTPTMLIPVYANGIVNDGLQGYTDKATVNEPCVSISARGTLGFCVYHEAPFVPIVRLIVATPNESIVGKYLYYALSKVKFENEGSSTPQLSVPKVAEYKIPLPPMDIQKKIVEECEKIDTEVTQNKEMIREMQTNMEAMISSLEGLRQPLKTIMCYGKERISYSEIKPETYVSTDNMEQNCEGIVPYNGTPNVNTVVSYQKGDILLSNIRPYLKKLWLANCNGGCSPDVLVLHNNRPAQVDSSFVYYSLRRQGFFDFIMSDIKGMKMPRGKKETIEIFEIILPSLDKQKEVVEKMSKIDEEISKAKQYVANASSAKQAILDKYLK